jgi:hypothetical protein
MGVPIDRQDEIQPFNAIRRMKLHDPVYHG